jgi:hypothetical protein
MTPTTIQAIRPNPTASGLEIVISTPLSWKKRDDYAMLRLIVPLPRRF